LESLKIRFASKEDVSLIKAFIYELAKFERLGKEVVVTEELLMKNLFGERAYAEVIIADLNEKPVGFALFFHNFSTFLGKPGVYLEDLYVREKARGRGVGKALLKRLAKICDERDCGRLEWWVLDWNESSIKFYQSFKAEAMDEWTVFRLSGDPLKELARE
jgi:GNAT superfamily N-acetyltransferase